MIVSHSHKFIFFHVPKTGGHTVAHRLANFIEVVEPKREKTPKHVDKYHFAGMHKNMFNEATREEFLKYPDYFSFAFVRNPWDRAFAFFTSMRRSFPGPETITKENFELEFDQLRAGNHRYQAHLASNQLRHLEYDDMCVTYIALFEDFEAEFETMTNVLSLPKDEIIYDVWENRSNFSNLDYHDFYTQQNIDWVAEHSALDIKKFGYTY